jgi:hypothetical protein
MLSLVFAAAANHAVGRRVLQTARASVPQSTPRGPLFPPSFPRVLLAFVQEQHRPHPTPDQQRLNLSCDVPPFLDNLFFPLFAGSGTLHCCAAQRVRLRGLSPRPAPAGVAAPENVGRQGQGQAAPAHGSQRRAAAAAGASPLTQGGNTPLFDAVREGTTDAQVAHALRQGLPHLTDTASLQDRRAGKQPEGTGTSAKGKQPAAQQTKRTRTTSQARTTQPAFLAADGFAAALGALPPDDWSRTWAAGRTNMLTRTSKRVNEVVDKMRLPAVVRLSRSFWDDARNDTEQEKRSFVLRQLTGMSARCRITTLELRSCAIAGPHAEWLAGGVLAQCPALVYLDLSDNGIGPDGAESLAGVLAQCRALAHLHLRFNSIGPVGAERLAGVLGQCAALAHLDLS